MSSEIELIGRIKHLTATIPLSKCAPASPALLNPFLFIRGLSCSSCIQASLSLTSLKLTISGFPYNCLPVSCGDIGFTKILGLVLAWKSGLKVPLLPLGRYYSLQTILLSDLVVGCDSPLQIVMAIGPLAHHYCQQRAVTPDPESSNSNKKSAKLPLLSAEGCHTRLEGQHCRLITYQGVFSRV